MDSKLFEYKKMPEGIYITGYKGKENVVKIPDKIKNNFVVGISSLAFLDNDYIKEIIMPFNIQKIEDSSFVGLINLKKIIFEKDLFLKVNKPFVDCNKVKIDSFENTAKSFFSLNKDRKDCILSENYIKKGNIISYEVPNLDKKECVITGIDNDKLQNISEELILPDYIDGYKIVNIEKYCNMGNYKKIKYPKHIKCLSCPAPEKFEEMILPEELGIIETCVFYLSTGKKITIPKSVKYIEAEAFRSSTFEEISFEIGSKLERVGVFAFSDMDINKLYFPNKNFEINEYVFEYSTIEKIKIREELTESEYGHSIFDDCELIDFEGY